MINNIIIDEDEGISCSFQNTEELVRVFEHLQEALATKIARFINIVQEPSRYYWYDLVEIEGDRFEIIGNDFLVRINGYDRCNGYYYDDYKYPISALDNPEAYKAHLEEKKKLEAQLKAEREAEEKEKKLLEKQENDYKQYLKLKERFEGEQLNIKQDFGDVGPNTNIIGVKIDNL